MLSTMHSIPTNGRKLNVAAYARVSSERYEAEMSLENQIDYYTTLILENPNWEYCGVYADEGISGTELLKRKQFKNMVEKALKGMIDIILVKSISRFGRNITDVIGAINKLRAKGVEVFFERENISTLDTTSTIALSLYAELAEQEVISMSQNCAWAVDKRNKAGRYRLPVEEMLGYEYNENNELVIVESEAEIIRQVFEMYVRGLGLRFIANAMMEKGYKTGKGLSNWTEKTITRILINEKYVGDAILQKSFSPHMSARTQHVNRGERDSYYVKDGHPAIIDRETWDAACALRQKRRTVYKREKGCTAKITPETGFGICPYCGKNYFLKRLANGKYGIKYTLSCSSNRNMLTCRESESVFKEDMKAIVLEQIKIIKSDLHGFKKLLKESLTFDTTAIKEELDGLNKKINEHKAKLETCSGKIDDAYIALKHEILEEIDNLILRKKTLENVLLTQLDNEGTIKDILAVVDSLSSTDLDQDYRKLFKRAVIKSRTDITFIIGGENLEGIDLLNLPKGMPGTHTIKVRAQLYKVSFGLYILPPQPRT